MDFSQTTQQQELLQIVQAITQVHCTEEQEADRDISPAFPAELFQALAKAGTLNLWATAIRGGGFLNACLVGEALSLKSSTASNLYSINGACAAMMAFAGGELSQALLASLGEGKAMFSFALTEATGGSDISENSATATLDGDEFVINGEKLFTTGAKDASHIVTALRTDPTGSPRRGTSLIIIPRPAEGLKERVLDKVAGNSVATCRLSFNNVRVKNSHLLGDLNNAWPILGVGAQVERLIVASAAIGLAQRAYDEVKRYLETREQSGKMIAEHQSIRHQFADMATQIEAMRWMTYRAAWMADQRMPCQTEVNMAKCFATEQSNLVVNQAMRLAGGRSYLLGDVLNRTWREASLCYFAGGTGELQRDAIAQSLAANG